MGRNLLGTILEPISDIFWLDLRDPVDRFHYKYLLNQVFLDRGHGANPNQDLCNWYAREKLRPDRVWIAETVYPNTFLGCSNNWHPGGLAGCWNERWNLCILQERVLPELPVPQDGCISLKSNHSLLGVGWGHQSRFLSALLALSPADLCAGSARLPPAKARRRFLTDFDWVASHISTTLLQDMKHAGTSSTSRTTLHWVGPDSRKSWFLQKFCFDSIDRRLQKA